MRRFTATEFGTVIRNGMIKANSTYLDWTGGWGISDGGIENFVSTMIAKEIVAEGRAKWGDDGAYVALELSFKNLYGDVFQKQEASSRQNENLGHRVDIVYFDGGRQPDGRRFRPRGVVEVKRWFDKSTYEKDIRRLGRLLKECGKINGGSLRYGCFVFFIFETDTSRKALQEKIDYITDRREYWEKLSECSCLIEHSPYPPSEEGPAKAASVAMIFQPNK